MHFKELVIRFPCFYLHYNTILMIVIKLWLLKFGPAFALFLFLVTRLDFQLCGLKVGQHISSYITSDSIKTTKY